MGYTYIILGAGKQGVAAAYDAAVFGNAERIILADHTLELARLGQRKIRSLLGPQLRKSKTLLRIEQIDVHHVSKLKALLSEGQAVLSALPYYLNPQVANLAVECGIHYCDLGGYFEVTRKISKLHNLAKKKGVTLIPDCGVSPGMCNSLAVCGMDQLDKVEDVIIYCGGLPQTPVGPLGYKVVFNLEGVLGNYFGEAYILQNGKIKKIPSLSDREWVNFGHPLGKLEAAVTGGATSTCPWTFKGKVNNYVYKTLRYPGHFEKIDLLNDLGLLKTDPVALNGYKIIPREFFATVAGPCLKFEDEPDLLALRVIVRGKKERKKVEIIYDVLDYADSKTGFSAMQRTTGFSSAIVLEMLAQGMIRERGVVSLERAVPGKLFLNEIRRRGIRVRERRGTFYVTK